jgi:beta-glucosidase
MSPLIIRDINIISIEILLHCLLSGKLIRSVRSTIFKVLICRSHGLSYSKFTLSNLQLSEAVVSGGEFRLGVSLTVENTGPVTGSEVVQVYISLPETSALTHPLLQLKGFAKVRDLDPGNKEHIIVVLDKYAVSYWNVIINAWTVEKGVYRVEVGTGSDCLSLAATFEVTNGFDWSGL